MEKQKRRITNGTFDEVVPAGEAEALDEILVPVDEAKLLSLVRALDLLARSVGELFCSRTLDGILLGNGDSKSAAENAREWLEESYGSVSATVDAAHAIASIAAAAIENRSAE